MATAPRNFQQNSYYHVYNRGNRKQPIFLDWNDHQRFLKKAQEYQKETGVKILCFCLMPNHFHFLLGQREQDQIFKFMLRLSTSYSKYFNIKNEQVGSLFQGPFKSKLIDQDEYLVHLSRYIHLNPSGRTMEEIINYPWSSIRYYCEPNNNELCDTSIILSMFSKLNPQKDYFEFVVEQLKARDFENIYHLLLE